MTKHDATSQTISFADYVTSYGFSEDQVPTIRRATGIVKWEVLGEALTHAKQGLRINAEQGERFEELQRMFNGEIYEPSRPLYSSPGKLVKEAGPEWAKILNEYDKLDALNIAGVILDKLKDHDNPNYWDNYIAERARSY